LKILIKKRTKIKITEIKIKFKIELEKLNRIEKAKKYGELIEIGYIELN
jgi:predicted RNA-binding protein